MAEMNLQIRMAAHPVGFPKSSDFEIGESSIPDIGEGEMLLKTLYLSVDPYMRGRMNTRKSYAAGVQIGEIMIGRTVSEVIASNDSDFAVGDIVWSSTGWQAYGVAQAKGVRKIDQALAPVSTALGILGMPGMTAYFGLLSVGQPKEGETVVVSAAAGAVGSLVGQIAKVKGCRAVGIGPVLAPVRVGPYLAGVRMVHFAVHDHSRDPEIAGCRRVFDDVPQLRSAGAQMGAIRQGLPVRRSVGRCPDDCRRAAVALGACRPVYRHGRRCQRVQGCLYRQERAEMRLRRR